MAGRIVVFGATGYTGTLAARALVAKGARPVLAGRDMAALSALAEELGGLETARADVEEPRSVRALVERDDVLVTTVGPFLKYGHAALDAAVDAGAHYIDCTGEPSFVREVFESYGPKARSALITAFGYDYVPGNLAGALALDRVGDDGFRVDIGYFVGGGDLWRGLTAGSLKSVAGAATTQMFTFRGRIHDERRPRVRDFEVGGRSRIGLSIGASEHFALPASYPAVYEVNVYLGWFGRATRLAASGRAGAIGAKVGLGALARLAGRRRSAKSTLTSRIVAVAYDADGALLTDVHLSGGDPYEFTANALSWAACQAADGMVEMGALGPVAAFGLSELEAGCAMAGIARVTG